MKRRSSEEQVLTTLRRLEAESSTVGIYRKQGVSSATFYILKPTDGGMDVSQVRKRKLLEDENARLTRLLTDAMLDNAVLEEFA